MKISSENIQPKKIKKLSLDAIMNRVNNMLKLREAYINDINNTHIHLQKGNTKTGESCWTISLIPIVDCYNCKECMKECYDVINDCWQPCVQNDRARNSALHKVDPTRYWNEISTEIKKHFVSQLRINVGGDLNKNDFIHIKRIAEDNIQCDFLFFTKSYSALNEFLTENEFSANVHPIISAWKNTELSNPFNLPVSHVLYADGSTTAPEYGSIYCNGNCSACHFNKGTGCWDLKKGESVIFPAH